MIITKLNYNVKYSKNKNLLASVVKETSLWRIIIYYWRNCNE